MRRIIASLALITATLQGVAQHPFRTNWQQVNSGQYRIIYPDYLAPSAARIASAMDSVQQCDTVNMRTRIKRIPIVMSGSSTTSNGYTTMFPYMMMLYARPTDSGELCGMDWYQNLITHEYRHIVQYNILDHGLTRAAHCVLGSYGWGGFCYSVPQWWYEGDAVYAETVTSLSGRGRSALFEAPIKAILSDNNKLYPYDKMLHRSYKDYIPNHYQLGYMMVTGARRQHGNDIWANTARCQSWYSFWPWAFGTGYRAKAGESLNRLYKNTFNELKDIYKQQTARTETYPIINTARKRCYTSYYSPKFVAENRILCLKSSLSKSNRFVLMDTLGHEVKCLGVTDANMFDTDGRVAVYASEVPDIRWSERSYSDIAVMDLESGRKYLITRKQKYFCPTLSPDGKRMAVVEFTQDRKCSIVVLELTSGYRYSTRVLASYTPQDPGNPYEYMRLPKYLGNNRIAYISSSRNTNAIKVLDVTSMKSETILPYTAENIIDLTADAEGNIYYTSDRSGTNNIYRISADGTIHQATNSKLGARYPDVHGNTLIFSQYSSKGNDIGKCDRMDEKSSAPQKTEYYKPLIDNEKAGALDFVANDAPKANALSGSKKYHQYSDPIRFLGWQPIMSESAIGAATQTANYLGTLYMSGQVAYYLDPGYARGDVSASYYGFYPVLSVGASLGEMGENRKEKDKRGLPIERQFFWREHMIYGSVSLPLNLSRMHYSQSINISAGMRYYIVKGMDQLRMDELKNGEFPMATASLSYSWSKQTAYRDFKSPLSLWASASTAQSVSDKLYAGITTLGAGLTIRGLFPQNYLSISGYMVHQNDVTDQNKTYIFNSSVFDVGGYESMRLQNMRKVTVDYSFPMGYPDCGIPGAIWFKRLRGSVFGTVADADVVGVDLQYASVGGQVLMDFCPLRLNYELSIGLWVSKGLKSNGLEGTEYGILMSLPF